MNEKILATVVIAISTLPSLGIGISCITRRWMPEQFSKSANSTQLQWGLGLGMLAISIGLLAFSLMILLLPGDAIEMMTPYFVVMINIVALAMVFYLLRKQKQEK